jgi:hypothetical protein
VSGVAEHRVVSPEDLPTAAGREKICARSAVSRANLQIPARVWALNSD